jgi:hypothetical protein
VVVLHVAVLDAVAAAAACLLQDYDLTDLTDWTDMKSCCESATRASIVDPECASLPPQPVPKPPPPAPAPVPPPAPTGPTVDESYCDPNKVSAAGCIS